MQPDEHISQSLSEIAKDPKKRKRLAEKSLANFALLYLPHYLKSPTPDFHYELYHDLQNDDLGLMEIIAFRGSAKSTIASLVFILWSAIFNKRKFIVLCADTFPQSKLMIANIKAELENNQYIKQDFGEFKGKDEEWAATNILLNNGVRIMSRSRGQQIRGIRHKESRPDLIVCDDVENIDDVRTIEQRDKTEEWFITDVTYALDAICGKLVLIGNLLHSDSLISRIKKKIEADNIGTLKEFPLIRNGRNLWEAEYPQEKIDEIKKRNIRYFQREYLLQIVAPENQPIKKVSYYNKLPESFVRIAIGVDLAISKKETADYTAINAAGEGNDGKFYNLKSKYARLNFNEALTEVNNTFNEFKTAYPNVDIQLGVEDVAYQKAAIEELQRRHHLPVQPIKQNKDKRSRLETLLPYTDNEQILFRREGMENLLAQMLNFGVEQHDDCVDAFEISMRLLINAGRAEILWI